MDKKIDLTGFINEEIELVIDDMVFNILTDPDVESWVFLMNLLSGKFKPEEYIEAQRKLVISLIVNNNKNVDITKLKKKLGSTALEQFITQYTNILVEKGVLKKVLPPKREAKKKKNHLK
ncbi:MAG: hypothetical protein PVJ67_04260 [Candidatus Pacearchaeota archaeon]|jgi:hypothetical protein